MKRYLTLEVKDRQEFEALQRAIADPEIRAFLLCIGMLAPLTPRGRDRVLRFVADQAQEKSILERRL